MLCNFKRSKRDVIFWYRHSLEIYGLVTVRTAEAKALLPEIQGPLKNTLGLNLSGLAIALSECKSSATIVITVK